MANANRRTTFVILASLDVPAPCRRQARAAAPAAYASTTCRGGVRSRRVQSQYTAEGASEVRVEDGAVGSTQPMDKSGGPRL